MIKLFDIQNGNVTPSEHCYTYDIRVWGNPMNGKGWDVEKLDGVITKIPPTAKRNMDFLKVEKNDKTI